MCRISCIVILAVCLFWCGGCNILEYATSDVAGWDVSACISGFDTCFELWRDNTDKFDDAFSDAMENLP